MKKKKKSGKKTKRKVLIKKIKIILCLCIVASLITLVCILNNNSSKTTKAMSLVEEFMSHINDKNYEAMYELIASNSKSSISKQDFINRNEEIYGKLEANYVTISNMSEEIEESTRKNKGYLYKYYGDTCWYFNFCKYCTTYKRR